MTPLFSLTQCILGCLKCWWPKVLFSVSCEVKCHRAWLLHVMFSQNKAVKVGLQLEWTYTECLWRQFGSCYYRATDIRLTYITYYSEVLSNHTYSLWVAGMLCVYFLSCFVIKPAKAQWGAMKLNSSTVCVLCSVVLMCSYLGTAAYKLCYWHKLHWPREIQWVSFSCFWPSGVCFKCGLWSVSSWFTDTDSILREH